MWCYEIVWIDATYDAGEAPTPSRCWIAAKKHLFYHGCFAMQVRLAFPDWEVLQPWQ